MNTDLHAFPHLDPDHDSILIMDKDPQKILVVDDETEIVELLEYNLKRNQYSVSTAYTGRQALLQAQSVLPDLIILDFMLPEGSGPEVASELKQNPETADIPIIFLTARSDTESILKGLGAGAVDYITKPFNFVELMARVKTQLQLKGALDRLKKTEFELKKAEVARDKLFTIFVHDIRSPFHSLCGFIERLSTRYEQLSDVERKNTIQIIRQGANHAQQLLSNLLQWNCLQNGMFQWNPQTVQLASTVTMVEQLLISKFDEKEIEFSSSIEEGVMVFADSKMVEAIIRNILQNSIKFTPNGGNIKLRSKRVGNKEEIIISDTGVGIREEALKRLFKVEYNQATVDLQGEKSTGMGLILSKEFVELNGGTIKVSSVPGVGSEFSFTLPCPN